MIDKDNANVLDLLNMATGGGAGGESLPEHAAADDGKVLTVQDDGSLGWDTPSGGMTVPYVAFTATETISDKVFWTRTLTASEEAAWAGVDWRSPGQLFVFNVNKATLNAADRRGNFVIRDSNGDLLVKGYIWTESAFGYLNGAVLTSNTGAASHSFVVACTMAASNSQAVYVTSYELPSTKAYAGKVLTVDANDVAQWMDAGIKQALTKAWSGKISVGSTAKTSTATRKEMILNRDFHGYVFEHAITGAIAADDECTFADFYIPEGCHEVYIYTKADGESSWVKRKQIKNIKPYKVGVADTEYLSWDGDNPQMTVYHDFTTVLGVALASGDMVRTVFVQDNGLDLDAVLPDPGIRAELTTASSAGLYLNKSTLVSGSPTRKEMLFNDAFHGFVFEHEITTAAVGTITFKDFVVREGCNKVFLLKQASGTTTWTSLNINGTDVYPNTSSGHAVAFDGTGDDPTVGVKHDFSIWLNLAAGDKIRTVFVQDAGLDSARLVPEIMTANPGNVLAINSSNKPAWAGLYQMTRSSRSSLTYGSVYVNGVQSSTITATDTCPLVSGTYFNGYAFTVRFGAEIAANSEIEFRDMNLPFLCKAAYAYRENTWRATATSKDVTCSNEYIRYENGTKLYKAEFTQSVKFKLNESVGGTDTYAFIFAADAPAKAPVATEVAAPIPAQWGSAFDFYFADTSDGNLGPNEISLDGTFDINADRVGVHAYGDNTLSEALTLISGTTYELYFRECPVLPKIAVLRSTSDPTDPSSYSQIVQSSNITFKAFHGDRMEFAATFTPSRNISLAQGEAFEVLLIP